MDDIALLHAVAGGDDRALHELFQRHAPWMAARLRGVMPADAVEDVLQETFIGVWRNARGFKCDGAARRRATAPSARRDGSRRRSRSWPTRDRGSRPGCSGSAEPGSRVTTHDAGLFADGPLRRSSFQRRLKHTAHAIYATLHGSRRNPQLHGDLRDGTALLPQQAHELAICVACRAESC